MWCENLWCGKRNLGHDEVVFDRRAKKVFCKACYEGRSFGPKIEVVDLTMNPPPKDLPQKWMS